MAANVPEISVVTPVYNEAPNLETLVREIVETMDRYGRSFEIIAVDDGSHDGSFDALAALRGTEPRLRVVRLARNFGQNPALYAGFERVRGRIVVTLDADLQNPPEDIPRLIDALEAGGHDIVQGCRQQRQDNPLRLLASGLVNRVVSRLGKVDLQDLGSGMKAYRREVVDRLCLSTHRSRYLPAETAWLGVKLGEVPVGHRSRTAGDSKYGLFALLRVNFDMLTTISAAPVQLIGLVGAVFAFIGFAMALRVGYVRLVDGHFSEYNSVLAVFFVLGGVQMLCTSIMCEYISRIYTEVQRRPYYIVGEVLED